MQTSESMTKGIRVQVESSYLADRSEPEKGQWLFAYRVRITNETKATIQLMSRHWIITDGNGKVEEVRGKGVVGEQPTLKPGESFEYTSGCPLETSFGTMEGTYQMVQETGDVIDVKIAPFSLSEPYAIN